MWESFREVLGAMVGLALVGFSVGSGVFIAAGIFKPTKRVEITQTYDNLDK